MAGSDMKAVIQKEARLKALAHAGKREREFAYPFTVVSAPEASFLTTDMEGGVEQHHVWEPQN